MSGVRIDEPCSENFAAMPKTEQGAYCDRCSFEVIDFTTMTTEEIRQVLKERSNQKLCGHIEKEQLIELNLEFENWREQRLVVKQSLMIALILVFGMSLFSCSSQADQRTVLNWREHAMDWVTNSGTHHVVDSGMDTTILGEIECVPEEIQTIEHYPTVDGGIGMDPEFREYLNEE